MFNNNLYSYGTNSAMGSLIWMIIAAVLAVIGGICLYFTVFGKANENKYTGFMKWLYDFVTFKKMMLETLLRVLYIITAIYITLASFALISTSFISFLLMLTLGNIAARITFEFSLVLLTICKNTTEINSKMKPDTKSIITETIKEKKKELKEDLEKIKDNLESSKEENEKK